MMRLSSLADRAERNAVQKVTIQKMDVKDLDEVLAIEASASPAPWSKNMFSEEIRNCSSCCFVISIEIESKQPVIGFICFRNMAEESELLNIAVHPRYRRLGVGRKLMQFYIDFSTPRGIKAFYLEVNCSNQSAIRLYQCFSYQSFGVRKEFYQRQFDALLMMKEV
jgi:ribosomal-protein-alanine N-acetyltransferase